MEMTRNLRLALVLSVCALAIGSTSLCVAAPPVPGDEQAAVQVPPSIEPLALEEALFTPEAQPEAVLFTCPADTQYCRYRWNKISMCCVAYFIAPGASCPTICL
jgi:hypothetical protein